jgi:urease accessory protein
MQLDNLQFLRLLQLADSALPVGATAHSFGLETLTSEDCLQTPELETFLGAYMHEAGSLEATFCRLAYRHVRDCCADESTFLAGWERLQTQLDAYKMARESRNASTTLGRRLLQLFLSLGNGHVSPVIRSAILSDLLQQTKKQGTVSHYCTVFGLMGAALAIDESVTVLAFLHQALAGFISACQRLLPLGQSQASAMLWNLKASVLEVSVISEDLARNPEEIAMFTPLVDLGSMRHPYLMTRLFIS